MQRRLRSALKRLGSCARNMTQAANFVAVRNKNLAGTCSNNNISSSSSSSSESHTLRMSRCGPSR